MVVASTGAVHYAVQFPGESLSGDFLPPAEGALAAFTPPMYIVIVMRPTGAYTFNKMPPETSGSGQVRLSHPLFSGPSPLRRQLFRVAGAPRNPKKPVFDFRAHFCHSAPMETHAFGFRLRANAPETKSNFLSVNAPEGQKQFPISKF